MATSRPSFANDTDFHTVSNISGHNRPPATVFISCGIKIGGEIIDNTAVAEVRNVSARAHGQNELWICVETLKTWTRRETKAVWLPFEQYINSDTAAWPWMEWMDQWKTEDSGNRCCDGVGASAHLNKAKIIQLWLEQCF